MKIKSCKDLIEFAASHGFTVGRRCPGVYYFGFSNGLGYIETDFKGTWIEFANHVTDIAAFVSTAKITEDLKDGATKRQT